MPTGRDTVARRTVLRGVGAGSITALAGCTGTDDDESDEESVPEPEAVDVSEEAAWRTTALTDVTTDEEFRVADVERPVIVHTFAVDCAVCQSQHGEFDAVYESAATDVEIVDLTIDPNDSPEDIRSHAAEEGYEWRFGTATDEVTSALVSDFGREVTSSASSPVIIVCPSGDVYKLEKVVADEHLESILADVCGGADSSDPSDANDSSGSNGTNDSTDSNDANDSSANDSSDSINAIDSSGSTDSADSSAA